MLFALPSDKRCWGEALISEQQDIKEPLEILFWAAGGTYMTAIELLKKSVQDQSAWLAALVLGMIAASVDLHSGSRWPHIILLFCSGLLIAFCSPRWTWRWTITLGLSLPALVLLSGNWGPYAVDRFDVFYGFVPATLGPLVGLAIRRIPNLLDQHSR
jgi:hypothetical protein